MLKKKILCSFLAGVMLLSTLCGVFVVDTAKAAPAEGVDVRVNGYLLNFPDKKPYVNKDSRTLIPVRFVAEALGANVTWNSARGAAQIELDGCKIVLPIGTNKMEVTRNGKTTTKTLDTTSIVEDGRTMIPIRAVAEELGCWVSYCSGYDTVEIYNDGLTAEEMNKIYSLAMSNWWTENGIPDEGVKTLMNTGKSVYENLSERAIRTCKDNWLNVQTPRKGWGGKTYDYYTQSNEDLIAFLVDQVEQYFAAQFTRTEHGVTANFRTNAGCVMISPWNHTEGKFCFENYHNIGVLTITFDKNANVKEYASHVYTGNTDLTKCKPGQTYTFVLDSLWSLKPDATWSTAKIHNITDNVNSNDWW